MVGRERILDLTIQYLRTHSLAEFSIASIAKSGNVDPALIRYYFGSKDGLLTELVSKLTAHSTTAGLRFLSDTGPIEQRFRRRVRALVDDAAHTPFYHELLVDRIFRRDDAAARAVLDDLARRATQLTRKLLDDGELRQVDPAFLHMLVIGACSFFASGRPLLDALRNRKTTDRTLDAFADFMADVLMNGLKPRQAAAGISRQNLSPDPSHLPPGRNAGGAA